MAFQHHWSISFCTAGQVIGLGRHWQVLALIVSKTTPIACCKFSTRDAQARRMQEVMKTTAKTVSSRLVPRNKPEEQASTTEPVVIVVLVQKRYVAQSLCKVESGQDGATA